jgi:hypothetical protein
MVYRSQEHYDSMAERMDAGYTEVELERWEQSVRA